PEVKKKITEEVIRVIGHKEINYQDLSSLHYTTGVIKESMRRFPPACRILRQAAKDDVRDGYVMKKGKSVVLSSYAVQGMEKYWENPKQFEPERFLHERIKHVHKCAYLPFGGGKRLCIGNNFAMMEMQIILALVCPKFDFTLAEHFKLE